MERVGVLLGLRVVELHWQRSVRIVVGASGTCVLCMHAGCGVSCA
jgi:hypothetical protein